MSKHIVAPVAEIPPGARRVVEAGGKRIVVFNLDGDFFALLDRWRERQRTTASLQS